MAENEQLNRLKVLIEDDNIPEAMQLLKNSKNQHFLAEHAVEIIDSACTGMIRNPDKSKSFCTILVLAAEKASNVNNVFLTLFHTLKQLKEVEDSIVHLIMFDLYSPLKIILQRIPGKRGLTLEAILCMLHEHVNTSYSIVDISTKDMYNLAPYLDFIEMFVDEVSYDAERHKKFLYRSRIAQQREILLRYLLKLCCEPLLYQDLHKITDPPSNSEHQHVLTIFCLLRRICKNVFPLFDLNLTYGSIRYYQEDDFANTSSEPLAFGTFAFLIFTEHCGSDLRPYVYHPVYIFQKFAPMTYCMLLLIDKEKIIHKGIHLLRTLLVPLSSLEIKSLNFDIVIAIEICVALLVIAESCPSEYYSNLAISTFDDFFKCLNWDLRHKLLVGLVNNDYPIYTYCVAFSNYETCLLKTWGTKFSSKYFAKKHLHKFLRCALHLKKGVKIDILEEFTKLAMSILFLLDLANRDPRKTNKSGLWDIVPFISKEFIRPLFSIIKVAKKQLKPIKKQMESNFSHKFSNHLIGPSNMKQLSDSILKHNVFDKFLEERPYVLINKLVFLLDALIDKFHLR